MNLTTTRFSPQVTGRSTIEIFGMLKEFYRSFTTDDHHLVHRVHFGKVFNTITPFIF